jgi:hypothetical protein
MTCTVDNKNREENILKFFLRRKNVTKLKSQKSKFHPIFTDLDLNFFKNFFSMKTEKTNLKNKLDENLVRMTIH